MDVLKELNKISSGNDSTETKHRSLEGYLVTLNELKLKPIPERKFLIGEWMPKDSFGMVFAKRGVGKSWFCMSLGISVAEGRSHFLGWKISGKQDVLFVDGEMAVIDIKQRLLNLCPEGLDNFHILPSEMTYRDGKPICLDEPMEQKAVDNVLKHLEHKGSFVQLIILDNLSTLRRGINENDNSETQKLIDWLVSLRHRGYTVILVHHSGKNGQQRGASIIEVPMDFVIKLEEPEKKKNFFHEGARFNLTFDKVRGKRPNPDTMLVSLAHDYNNVLQFYSEKMSNFIDKKYLVLRYLMEKGPRPQRKISEDLDMALGLISTLIKELKQEDLLQPEKSATPPNTEGKLVLHKLWPDKFKVPTSIKNVHYDEAPF